ncbi:Ribonuclease H-like domain containing protein [Trema orientale]|uniref:Ribonuclease H-like domain containing protein n=1 Tax=Trema orientale TaxID=63057 RepID=A0A2P5EAK9_TREOI|nr:Ribonuclease H-like domain containing protein [Trema orientale]
MSKLIAEDEFKFTLIVLWIIWFERKKVLHGGTRRESALVASWAERFYKETDAAYVQHLGVAGLGFMIRNHDRKITAVGTKRVPVFNNVTMIETFAVRSGIQVAKQSGLFPCPIKTDCLSVVNLAKSFTNSWLEEDLLTLGW